MTSEKEILKRVRWRALSAGHHSEYNLIPGGGKKKKGETLPAERELHVAGKEATLGVKEDQAGSSGTAYPWGTRS